jgi:hypothetical protein
MIDGCPVGKYKLWKSFYGFSLEIGLDGCFNLAIPGLSFVCSESRERCNWAFHGAAHKLLQGIISDIGPWIHNMVNLVY